jgi:hypothetical protein
VSNYLAIATVTATLQAILQEVANEVGGNISVTIERPAERSGAQKDTPGLNIFLYRVDVNGTYSNHDLPTRNSLGQVVARPQIALDLNYLLTFYGSGLVPQTLLGHTMSILDAQPLLSRAAIQRVTANGTPELAASDLAEQVERVRFSPVSLDLEEMSKLWGVFPNVPYTLSVAYRASVVLIDAPITVQRSLPVRPGGAHRRVAVGWLPQIEQVSPQFVDYSPTQAVTVTLHGRSLVADEVDILLADAPIASSIRALADGSLAFELPKGITAGIKTVRVQHRWQMDGSSRTLTSNPAVLTVRPTVLNRTEMIRLKAQAQQNRDVFSGAYPLMLTPPLVTGQQARLLLNQLSDDAPAAFSIDFTGEGDTLNVPLMLPREQFKPGTYLVRVSVDGAESGLELVQDPETGESSYSRPSVTLEAP